MCSDFHIRKPVLWGIKVEIHNPATGERYAMSYPFFLHGYRTDKTLLSHLSLTETYHWPPSEKKVGAGLKNCFLIISQYLIPVLQSNFDWTREHDTFKANMKKIADALGPQWYEVIPGHPVYLKLIEDGSFVGKGSLENVYSIKNTRSGRIKAIRILWSL